MTHTTYSQKVDTWLRKVSGCSLLDFCRKFRYYDTAVRIMELNPLDERGSKIAIKRSPDVLELYTSFSKDAESCSREGANRSWTNYFQDLIAGWVMEDLTKEMLASCGLEVRLNGKDSKREIKLRDARQDADYLIRVGDNERRVELTSEFNPILETEGYIEKRCPALIKLYEAKGIWVYRDLSRGKYVLVDFAAESVNLQLRHHEIWTKDVHRYVLAENGKKERDDRLLVPELISIIGCGLGDKEQPSLMETEAKDHPPKVFGLGGTFRDNKLEGPNESSEEQKPVAASVPIRDAEGKKPQQDKRKQEKAKTIAPVRPEPTPAPENQQIQDDEFLIMDSDSTDVEYEPVDFV